MKKSILPLFIILFLAFTVQSFVPSPPVEEINWVTFNEAIELNKENPKKILIDIGTSWCGYCKKMDRETFSNADIAKFINKRYYAVKMDGEHKEPITVGDKVYNFVQSGRRGYHELPKALMQGSGGYPTVVIMDENFNRLEASPGFKTPPQMDVFIRYYGDDHYKSTSRGVYEKTYRSKVK